MLNLPLEKKWQIYCNGKKDQDGETDLSHLPEHYIERVEALFKVNILYSRIRTIYQNKLIMTIRT